MKRILFVVHEKDNSSKTYQYQLNYENKKRILELDGVSYINGDDIYDAMNLGNVGTVVGSVLELIQEFIQYLLVELK